MSKELLISLLENGIKKTIDRLDNNQTNEMNSLNLLTNHMSSIKKTYNECSNFTEKLLKKLKEDEEKKLIKSEANLTEKGKRRLKGNKSQGSILNNSSIIKKNQPIITERNNPSSSFISLPKKRVLKSSKTEKLISPFNTEENNTKRKITQPNKTNITKNTKEKTTVKAVNSKGNKSSKRVINYSKLIERHWNKISEFLSQTDLRLISSYSKKFSKLYFESLFTQTKKELEVIEQRKKEITEKYNEEEFSKPINSFSFSRAALKAFELLNEENYSKLFAQPTQVPSSNILNVYKIFFQLINKDKEKEVLKSKNDVELWGNICDYFTSMNKEETKLGTALEKLCSSSLDVSENNIYFIFRICLPLIDILNPLYFSEKCSTTSLFLFIIKDPLEYVGILPDRRTQPGIIHKYATYSIMKDNELIEKLASIKLKFI